MDSKEFEALSNPGIGFSTGGGPGNNSNFGGPPPPPGGNSGGFGGSSGGFGGGSGGGGDLPYPPPGNQVGVQYYITYMTCNEMILGI